MCLLCGFVRELASTGNLKLLNVWQSIWNFVALASGNQILSLPNGTDQEISAPYSYAHQQIYFCENCLTDIIDPIKDQVSSSDYSEEEDPLLYQSTKTGRGPMKENWLEQYRVDKPPSDVMCAYKLIKVEFRYWGMQVNVDKEGFLCFVAFRRCFKFVFFY